LRQTPVAVISKNTRRVFLNFSLVLLATLFSCLPATGQQKRPANAPALNFGFVSPNTREDLTLNDAIEGLKSTEETNLLQRIQTLRCVVRRSISTRRALGSWIDGAEPSILLRITSDEPTMRYLMSRLGKDANQKAVLYFHSRTKGSDRIYIIRPAKHYRFATLNQLLDQSGISFRTIVPSRHTIVVYVVDTENNLGTKVKIAAQKLRARVSSQPGDASFIGDDVLREKGQAVFQQEINYYESKHPNLPPACKSN